jgi:hypothetical protein
MDPDEFHKRETSYLKPKEGEDEVRSGFHCSQTS